MFDLCTDINWCQHTRTLLSSSIVLVSIIRCAVVNPWCCSTWRWVEKMLPWYRCVWPDCRPVRNGFSSQNSSQTLLECSFSQNFKLMVSLKDEIDSVIHQRLQLLQKRGSKCREIVEHNVGNYIFLSRTWLGSGILNHIRILRLISSSLGKENGYQLTSILKPVFQIQGRWDGGSKQDSWYELWFCSLREKPVEPIIHLKLPVWGTCGPSLQQDPGRADGSVGLRSTSVHTQLFVSV